MNNVIGVWKWTARHTILDQTALQLTFRCRFSSVLVLRWKLQLCYSCLNDRNWFFVPVRWFQWISSIVHWLRRTGETSNLDSNLEMCWKGWFHTGCFTFQAPLSVFPSSFTENIHVLLWNGILGKLLLLSYKKIILSLIRDFGGFLSYALHSWRCRSRPPGTIKRTKNIILPSSCCRLPWLIAAVSPFQAVGGSSLSLH